MTLARSLAVALLASLVAQPALAHDVTATANGKIRVSFDILQARAEVDGNKVTFISAVWWRDERVEGQR